MAKLKLLIRKLALFGLLTIMLSGSFLALWASVFAQTDSQSAGYKLSVSPPRNDFVLSPGDTVTGTAGVTNLSGQSADVQVILDDFGVDDNGVVALLSPNPDNPQSLSGRMTLQGPIQFTLADKERRDVPYTINIPAGTGGGSRYAAIVFSTGPAPEPGKVRIMTQVTSLVTVQVRGAMLNPPSIKTSVTIQLPVAAAQGTRVTELHDPTTGLVVTTPGASTSVSVPLQDHQGATQAQLIGESQSGLIGNGTTSTMTLEKLQVRGNLWQADTTAGNFTIPKAGVQLGFDVNSVTANSEVRFLISSAPSQSTQAAIDAVAQQASADVKNVAYVLQVEKLNVSDGVNVVNGRITMRVSREWADANDPSLVRILRYADDGSAQVLDTTFKGYEGDMAVFEGVSPRGLSVFSLVAFNKPVSVIELPTGSLPEATVSLPPDDPNLFVIVLTPDIRASAQAVATDQQGKQLLVSTGSPVSIQTQFTPPTLDDVPITLARQVQTGALKWTKAPGVALTGTTTLELQFQNTGLNDYQVASGLVTVVGMRGKTSVNMGVEHFNAFAKGNHDLTLQWATPSGAFGRYTMSAQVTIAPPEGVLPSDPNWYPTQTIFSNPISVWIIPWKWIISALLIGGGIVALGWMLVRAAREHIRKELEKRIRESQSTQGPGNGQNGA